MPRSAWRSTRIFLAEAGGLSNDLSNIRRGTLLRLLIYSRSKFFCEISRGRQQHFAWVGRTNFEVTGQIPGLLLVIPSDSCHIGEHQVAFRRVLVVQQKRLLGAFLGLIDAL